MTMTTPLILIDGSSYLYRAFHAMPQLSNSAGEPTGAIYGVINMVRKLQQHYQPQQIAVVFDAPGKTFRDELYSDYKATRSAMPDELRAQIAPLHQALTAAGLPLFVIAGVEADDVIGTLARRAEADGQSVIISSGDKDMAQLVSDHITLIDTMKGSITDTQGVVERFGVLPEQIIGYLALMGDSSDNVPGIPKVGEKTAAKWLQHYGSLDTLIDHAAEIKGKVGESLRSHLPQLALARQLVTIRCDVDLGGQWRSLTARQPPDTQQLRQLYQRFEFKSWLKELLESGSEETSSPLPIDPQSYPLITTEEALQQWLTELNQCEQFAFDTETTSLDYIDGRIVGIAIATAPNRAAYLPLAHSGAGSEHQLNRDAVLAQFKPLLEGETPLKCGQNLKYDSHILRNHGITLRGIGDDTMLQSYLLDSTASRHDMDSLALKYLGYKTISYQEVAGKGAKQIGFAEVALSQAAPYAAEDAAVTLALQQQLSPKLAAEPTLQQLYRELELPLLPLLVKMEHHGVLIDTSLLRQQSLELTEKLARLEQQLFDAAGEPFNPASPKQIQALLFEKQSLPILKKTPKGQPSTAEEVLQELALDYELPQLILQHRSLAKLKSTYTDKLPKMVNPTTGRVHTSYHQAVAATGRLSSSDPNLQNIPIRTPEGRRIRQAFIAPPDHYLLAADYSQIELRIMAHLSQDSGLVAAFHAGEDIHRATAAELFATALDQVTYEQRRSAKAINFGLIYGMSAFGLAKQLGIERNAAQDYINLYFSRYPGVKAYMDRTRELAREQGYVETLFGRRLYLPEIHSRNAARRQYAERTAINAPMQGTAADIIKRAMLKVGHWLSQQESTTQLLMQVHDELVFELPKTALESTTATLTQLMESAAELRVPLKVECGHGENWDEAH
ncbi:DNA polymerase I [Ectothiorhodospiraceae bacterium BW-2]|nr:DNA polymerase I [Ectothiorhodospiraceae bacterium BW-2]